MLTAENASLVKRLADVTQKYKEATIDNTNLIVDVQTMRRKVRSSAAVDFQLYHNFVLLRIVN